MIVTCKLRADVTTKCGLASQDNPVLFQEKFSTKGGLKETP
jgi:hypothetical protein